jgi:large conductance mechanosensitive channel
MKTFFEEFKKFALRGNVLDLAVGIVIGTAFSNITNSLVTNIITPPIGLLLGNADFKNLAVNLGGSVNIQYGLFVQAILDFLIIAFALFLFVRFINRVTQAERHKKPQPEETKSPEQVVLEEIRDQLKNRA